MIGSYGGKDRSLRKAPARLEHALHANGVDHDVKVYPEAGHSFLNDHDPADASAFWRILAQVSGSRFHEASAADARSGSSPSSTNISETAMAQPDDRRGGRDPTPPAALLVVLSAGPKTSAEIEDSLLSFGRRPPGERWPRPGRHRSRATTDERLAASLEEAIAGGWVLEAEGRFDLTDVGRAEALDLLDEARNRRELVHHLLEPTTASRRAVFAQIGITALEGPRRVGVA